MKKAYHGDVLLMPINGLPEGAKSVSRKNGKLVLREGEQSGHAHIIEHQGAEMFSLNGLDFLVVSELVGVSITHQEHNPGLVAPGTYQIRATRERDHLSRMTGPVLD